jgi:hypothetical protein
MADELQYDKLWMDWVTCILTGNNNADIITCLERFSQQFYDNAKQEIPRTNPAFILYLLKKFGFRKHLVYDSFIGSEIWKVETIDHLQKSESESETLIQFIINDPKSTYLLQYLNSLVEYVNSNPQTLNKNICL